VIVPPAATATAVAAAQTTTAAMSVFRILVLLPWIDGRIVCEPCAQVGCE
jgi:hypothetical protein